MKQTTKFSPERDRQGVLAGLAVNLGECLAAGSVPAKLGPSDVEYNGISNPADVMAKVGDAFEAQRLEAALRASADMVDKAEKEEPKPAPEKGAPESSQE